MTKIITFFANLSFSATGFPCRLRFFRLTNEASTYNVSKKIGGKMFSKGKNAKQRRENLSSLYLTSRSDHLMMALFPKSKFWSFLFRANSAGRV